MGVDYETCAVCGGLFVDEYVSRVFMRGPDENEEEGVTFDADEEWGYNVPSLYACDHCIDKEDSIVEFGNMSYYFCSDEIPSKQLDMKLKAARELLERVQYYRGKECVNCKKEFEIDEEVGVCVTCKGSVHAVGCMVEDVNGGDERCYERRVGITHGVCMVCENESITDEDLARMEAANGEGSCGSKKRKLEG
jgi:hypothetical protein